MKGEILVSPLSTELVFRWASLRSLFATLLLTPDLPVHCDCGSSQGHDQLGSDSFPLHYSFIIHIWICFESFFPFIPLSPDLCYSESLLRSSASHLIHSHNPLSISVIVFVTAFTISFRHTIHTILRVNETNQIINCKK